MRGYILDFRKVNITLESFMTKHKISKNSLCRAANLQYTQLQLYYNKQIQRPDLDVLSRICYVLECDISDILEYSLPEVNE